ncbi:MAG: hypothetical protein IPO08_23715 [Xanthomonadales bacterium]|nr:hypothetical protein [Xanthomonadales bacterium]
MALKPLLSKKKQLALARLERAAVKAYRLGEDHGQFMDEAARLIPQGRRGEAFWERFCARVARKGKKPLTARELVTKAKRERAEAIEIHTNTIETSRRELAKLLADAKKRR